MNTVYKVLVILVMMAMPAMAFASYTNPVDMGDTIPAIPRSDDYYFTKWFDDCPNYRPNGIVDSCVCHLYKYHNYLGGDAPAKGEHINGRLKVKGLVAMLQHYNPPTIDSLPGRRKLPEYLYLNQLVGRHHLHNFIFDNGLDFMLLDSVRWDTATARVMELTRGWNGEYTQYCYLYEAYFENPVYVDSDFYIYGSTNSNNYGSAYIHTVYVDIMDLAQFVANDKCDINLHYDYADVIIEDGMCEPEGLPYATFSPAFPEEGWYINCLYSPVGYYLLIVDKWNLDVSPNDSVYGQVEGGGRWPDESFDTIRAIPTEGCYFVSWNDGNTDNPRVVQLLSDTSFVAIFQPNESANLQVVSANTTQGTVSGGGSFRLETHHTISATPNYGHNFSHWNDGVTDNPRDIYLVSDTTFIAYFVEKAFYDVQIDINNEAWGTVTGAGTYMEGENATLSAIANEGCTFSRWTDGALIARRTVTVTQDTLFTAIFSKDSTQGISGLGILTFSVAPNPTTGLLTITTALSESHELTIYDVNGKALLNMTSHNPVTVADISAFPSGQYFLVVRTHDRYGVTPLVKH